MLARLVAGFLLGLGFSLVTMATLQMNTALLSSTRASREGAGLVVFKFSFIFELFVYLINLSLFSSRSRLFVAFSLRRGKFQ